MDIFSVPIEVVDANVLPYLEWNDLLRLRRVCKWTKGITDSYLKVHPELAPEIEINEDEKGFDAFVKMGIPTNRIFLNNQSGDEFYHNGGAGLSKFLKEQGHLVKFLRVDQLSLMIYGKEWDFLVALKNIESFEAGRLGGYPRELTSGIIPVLEEKRKLFRKDPRAFSMKTMRMTHPKEFFMRLKTLKIGTDENLNQEKLFEYCDAFLSMGGQLQFISLPFDPNSTPEPDYFPQFHGRQLALASAVLLNYVLRRSRKASVTNYKVIDFVSYHDIHEEANWTAMEREGSPVFLELCGVALRNDVKLSNVNSNWFQERRFDPRLDSPDLGIPVVSLVNLHPSVLPVSMPNLEKIEIRSSRKSSPGTDWRADRSVWSSLKTLDITVDSDHGLAPDWIIDQEQFMYEITLIEDLFGFFFQDISRTSLTELRLQFEKVDGPHSIPNTEQIVTACPNLKKLTLGNWPGTNEALAKLWNGLPSLEEVTLECCNELGNEAFVGEDVRSPVFLKLGNLKKLTLKGLDQMPKVTDKLFIHVLAHIKLTHLYLTTDWPIKSVTLAGLRALSEGRFAGSIEKFPFKNWSLANVSEKKFRKMEEIFRSFRML